MNKIPSLPILLEGQTTNCHFHITYCSKVVREALSIHVYTIHDTEVVGQTEVSFEKNNERLMGFVTWGQLHFLVKKTGLVVYLQARCLETHLSRMTSTTTLGFL